MNVWDFLLAVREGAAGCICYYELKFSTLISTSLLIEGGFFDSAQVTAQPAFSFRSPSLVSWLWISRLNKLPLNLLAVLCLVLFPWNPGSCFRFSMELSVLSLPMLRSCFACYVIRVYLASKFPIQTVWFLCLPVTPAHPLLWLFQHWISFVNLSWSDTVWVMIFVY